MAFFLCPACGESSFSDVDSFLLHRAMYCRKVKKNEDMSSESREKETLPDIALGTVGTGEDTSVENKSFNSRTGGEGSQVYTRDANGRHAKSPVSNPDLDTSSAALSKVVIQVGGAALVRLCLCLCSRCGVSPPVSLTVCLSMSMIQVHCPDGPGG